VQSPRSHYFHYFHYGLASYADRVLVRVRADSCDLFLRAFAPAPADTILDVGVSANDHASSNYLEKVYPHPEAIVGLATEPHLLPGIRLVCGDGRTLPFADGSFDFVYSHAVMEHVGSREQQARFVAEALRVCRKGVFLTTPNRWHPFEFHTGLPLLHYLPAAAFRWVCRRLGKDMYASEANLNLLTRAELLALAGGRQIEVHEIRWLGLVSNLALAIRKAG
jgi:hypothetical protein